MATIAPDVPRSDKTATAKGVDRWIFVFMASWFIAIVLVGFIPDSRMKLAMIDAGMRPPFAPITHIHALCMGAFLLLLLAQSTLMALGRETYHRQLGRVAFVLVPILIVAGLILSPTNYHGLWNAALAAPPERKADAEALVSFFDNITLVQMRIGILFAILVTIALRARKTDTGLHKRMMFLSIAPALPAAFDRMTWLPTTIPESAVGPDLWVLFALAPMFFWDILRHGKVHRAYWLWLAIVTPFTIFVHVAWDQPWWHEAVRSMMGV